MRGCGSRQTPGSLNNMSEDELGCFGKLPFAELDLLQREHGVSDTYWADALPTPAILNGISSIDTVALDPRR